MADAARHSVDELLAMESQLDRSSLACVVVLLSDLASPFVARVLLLSDPLWGSVFLALHALLVGVYLWFAVSVGRAARAVGNSGILFVSWVLAAPFLALAPVPFVSTILAASPLSLKFLLSGQLRSRIHDQTFEE